MKRRSGLIALIVAVCMVITMVPFAAYADEITLSDEIVVLYSSDINGGVAENLGVSGMAAYANEMKATHKYVELVDAGNAIGGSVLASVSKGEYVVEALNAAGYTMAVPGTKEFSYDVNEFVNNISTEADYEYLSCNFRVNGTEGHLLSRYKIVAYGDTKVAYIGISDPDIINQQEAHFKLSDGTNLYTFEGVKGEEELYASVQTAIDDAKAAGADYVIAIGNLRNTTDGFNARSVIQNTSGINAFINSNSGKAVSGEQVKDKDGTVAMLTSPGAGLNNIGVLTIDAGKSLTTQLITSYKLRDVKTADAVEDLTAEYSAGLKTAFATTSSRLEAASASGSRTIEAGETNLGDLVADAYRAVTGADVALVDASEVATSISVGGISYNDVIRALPENDGISVAQISGFDLMDALEMSVRLYPAKNKNFLQVSGITFDIQEAVLTSVSVDGLGNFVSVDSDYRVTNVMIGGKPIDLMETYTVAGSNSLLNGETGYTMLTNGPLAKLNVMTDNLALITFISDNLKGSVGGAYSKSQLRMDSIILAKQSEIDALVEAKAEEKIKEYKEELEALKKEMEIQSDVIALKTLEIDASSSFSKVSGKRKVKVTWKVSEEIEGVKYQVYKSSKKSSGYTKMYTTSGKSYTNSSGLTKGNTYYYKVRAYKYLNGKYYYSDWSDKTYKKITK